MKKSDTFPSSYLKVDDVSGVGEEYTIKEVSVVEFKDPKTQEVTTKPVVWFGEIEKGLILNRTNWDRIVKKVGAEDSDDWADKKITLRLEAVNAFGKDQDAIRVI